MRRELAKYVVALLWLTPLWGTASSPFLVAQSTGSLSGAITDPSGAVFSGVTVTLASTQGGQPKATITNSQGTYEFRGVAPGTYTISVEVTGFALYVKENLDIRAGQPQRLDIALEIAVEQQQAQVSADAARVDVNPVNNSSTLGITQTDLDALSDDPDELESQLLALAGPAAGPNGGQIYVDGFTIDTNVPPKNTIREIHVNQNPFSAAYDRVGYGRIEILTKPGTNQLHGRITADGNDLAFDTRDPFAVGEPGYHSFLGTADVSGPIGKKASFFLDYQHRDLDNNAIVSAVVLDPSLVQTPFAQTVAAPSTLDVAGPRFDYAVSPNNILTVSYQLARQTEHNLGVGQFALASQGYTLHSLQNVTRANDTQIVGAHFDNQVHFQSMEQSYTTTPVSLEPEILVIGGFTGGGNTQGYLNYHHHHLELDDDATFSLSKHTLIFGGRIRTVVEPYVSPGNFNGTYTFSSLSTYAAGTPRQFTLAAGNPSVRIFSEDTGVYFSDDWRVRRNFILSYGLRFETQNYIDDHADWAPRIGLAYGIGRGSNPSPKTVLRVGFGIFYDRFGQQLQIQAELLNGTNQTEYLVNDPQFYPNIPTVAELTAAGAATTVYRVAPNLHSPYTIQSAVGIERQVSRAATVSVTYLNSYGGDQMISNNINAPLPGTYNPAIPNSGTRPFPSLGNIYEYQSVATFEQNQLITNFNVRASRGISLFGVYTLNHVNSDTAGPSSFPNNPYDIAEDYGRAAFDIRSRAVVGGTISLKHGILLSPLMNFQSGTPFNITIGQDLIGSTIFNQRPAFATSSTPAADIVSTSYGAFNINPAPGEPLIPINYGGGPNNFVMNLRASKTFSFESRRGERAAGGGGTSAGGAPAPGGVAGAPSGGYRVGSATQASGGGDLGGRGLSNTGGSGGSGGSSNKRYSLTLTANARNLFNDVNLAPPTGNLTSPIFGKSNGLAGGVYSFSGTNRRIDFQVVFAF
jgi:hypothetical protein